MMRYALIVLMLLADPIWAAQPPQHVQMDFAVTSGALHLGDGRDVLEHDGKQYSVISELKTVGLAAILYKLNIRRESRGLITKNGLRPLDRNDLLEVFRRQGLDVGPVRELGIRHDRGRVRVDQADLVALLAQGLDALRAGVVELAALPDDDRAGADDEDLLKVVSLGHWPPGGRASRFGSA